MIAFSQLRQLGSDGRWPAGEGGQVVDVFMGVDEAGLHLHQTVVSFLSVLFLMKERLEKLEDMSSMVRTQPAPLWTVNLSLVMNSVILGD